MQTTISRSTRLPPLTDFGVAPGLEELLRYPKLINTPTAKDFQYSMELPKSVVKVDSLDDKAFNLFLRDDVEALLVQRHDDVIQAAIKELQGFVFKEVIRDDGDDWTMHGRIKSLKTLFRPEGTLSGLHNFELAIEKDLRETGAFLDRYRTRVAHAHKQFWGVLFNDSKRASELHVHMGHVFAVRSYKGAGTEFLLTKEGLIFQLALGDLMVFKGHVMHRQPPRDNIICPYESDGRVDQRALLSMSVDLQAAA